jgi:hypothetical protein
VSSLLVVVLPIVLAPKGELTTSEVYQRVAQAAELRPTLRLLSIDQWFFQEGGELANRTLACAADTACIASQLAPFDADLGIVVIANLEIDPPLLSILLLDTAKRETIGESTGEVSSAIERAILQRTVALLDAAGHPRSGRLFVQVSPPNAAIAIGGAKPDLGAPNRFTVPPGSYDIVASADGFEGSTTLAHVKSGETTHVSITLSEETSVFETPWFWVVTSAVVVAAAATATGIALSSTERCVCVLTADGRDCTVCN